MFTRVLIVDDELLACNQLRAAIDWEEHGYMICGEAENGLKAIELIEELQPHLVLMDIDMPLMNGVSLCRYISEHYQHIATIVLSNYDQFEYVRDTLHFGAVDYLLKHKLTEDHLLDVLEQASKKMKLHNTTLGDPKVIYDHYSSLQSSFHKMLFSNDDPQTYFDEQLSKSMRSFHTNTIVLVMQPLDLINLNHDMTNSNEGRQLFINSVIELCRQIINDPRKGIIIYDSRSQHFIFLLSYAEYTSEMPILQSVQALENKIRKTLLLIYNVSVIFGRSPICHSLEKIKSYYEHAIEALNQNGNTENQTSASFQQSAHNNIHIAPLSIKEEKELLAAIVMKSFEQVESIIDGIFESFNKRKDTHQQFMFLVEELIHLAHRVGNKYGADVSWIAQDLNLKRPKLSQSYEVQLWVKTIYQRLIEEITHLQTEDNYSKYVADAIKLIKQHYRQGISLEEAASKIGITTSYLSRLVKEETGISFTENVNKYRIELSKKFIESGQYTIKQLYSQLGFNTYSYFFKVFKQIVGETPHTYAKRYKKSNK